MIMIGDGENACEAHQVLSLLEDETLFSWCARYHQLAVNGNPRATVAQLFGRATIRCVHDLPTHLSALAARAGDSLGSAEEIMRHCTILPFYLAFKSTEASDTAISAVSGSGSASLKFKLGLLTSGLGAAHPLKACPQCMRHDLATHQTSYWHVAHQLPGAWVCTRHGQSLYIQSRDLHPSRRFDWVLPSHVGLVATASSRDNDFKIGAALSIRMAEYSLKIHAAPASKFSDAKRIARAFRMQLRQHGWLTSGGSVKWNTFGADLAAFVEQSCQIPQFSLSSTVQLGRIQLARILSGRSLTHPLRYLLWICFVFDRWESFLDAYDACSKESSTETGILTMLPSIGRTTPAAMPGRAAAVKMLESGTKSMTAIAAELGVCPSTVASWAAKQGITTARRPKKLHDAAYSQAVALLKRGADKKEVCKKFDLSVVTVTRLLRNVPGLQAHWHLVREEKTRAGDRATWILISASHQDLGISARRALVPKIYARLYRNDRAWLCALESDQQRSNWGNHASMRMRLADERYAKSLTSWVDKFAGEASQMEQLGALIHRVPSFRKIALAPQNWPLTMAVIARVTKAVDGHADGNQQMQSVQLELL